MNSGFTVLTVSQLNFYVRSLLESDVRLARVFLRAEISNFTNHYRSGHLYMTLKDENAVIKAVMFRSSAQKLSFLPYDGMKVIASGRVSVYERDGQYQFYIDDLQPDGVGALFVAYEQLRRRLAEEGLFDEARKKPLPPFPERIGVVTSPVGAALQDIRNILGRRWPLAKIVLVPVEVQGSAAPAQIAAAVSLINSRRAADVIICGRGGGSLEELWAFNDERVARAIAASEIPVVSAVGHETDYTIADFAADLRAPTPSAAAELVSPDARALAEAVAGKKAVLNRLMEQRLLREEKRLKDITASRTMKTPLYSIELKKMRLDALVFRLNSVYAQALEGKRRSLAFAGLRLDALSPLKVLSRGYAVVSDPGGIVTGVKELHAEQEIGVRMRDGKALCKVLSVDIEPAGKDGSL